MSSDHLALLKAYESASDVSSAGAEIRKRRQAKKATIKIDTPLPPKLATPPFDLSIHTQSSVVTGDLPLLRSFTDLVNLYPHLKATEPSKSKLASTKEQRANARSQTTEAQFTALETELKTVENPIGHPNNTSKKQQIQSASKPCAILIYEEKLAQLITPMHYHHDIQLGPLTIEQSTAALRRKQLHLPCNTASHESAMFKEGGRFRYGVTGRVYDFPYCARGTECVGMTTPFPGKPKPFRFMAFMREEQFIHFLETDEAPTPTLPCIGCLRTTFEDFIVYYRALKNQPDCSTSFTATEDTDIIPQLYVNLIDCTEGYYKKHMIQTQHKDPMLEAIARLQCSFTFIEPDFWDPTRASLNQEAMIWKEKPMPSPRIGESASSF